MLEEVSDLGFQQFRQVVHVFHVIVLFGQLAVRYRNQLGVFTGFVGHLQHANRTAADHGARLQRVWGWDQHVNRVTVQRQGVVDVAVVARVEHRGGHETVNEQRAGFFVDFVFDWIGVGRDFDYYVDVFRQVFASRDQIQAHVGFL